MGRILVIDDHDTVRRGLAKIIEKMGHQALTAASGHEGLELFDAHDIDFVITDLKMEGITITKLQSKTTNPTTLHEITTPQPQLRFPYIQ